jgi:hypothetical protein
LAAPQVQAVAENPSIIEASSAVALAETRRPRASVLANGIVIFNGLNISAFFPDDFRDSNSFPNNNSRRFRLLVSAERLGKMPEAAFGKLQKKD